MKSRKIKFKDGESALRQIRQALGKISQEEFARRIGTTVRTVSRWEKGDATPTFTIDQVKNLKREIESIGLTIEDLPSQLGRTKPPATKTRGTAKK
ncbi:helix-turn-helix transcriptional regulator [Lusitaniella coriacea LEGE 07157]|uniref:Helix-turn-helix transcriptional regulator n=1 Tax=Lusitaniella coriacea LEGE 07157 TaxID=945747 RepID=A0A8J7E3C4_9CYAN|nr:helix-turn-helix transcriptional regulator [Lusitaniella coriacea LEGE 07157]